MTRRPRSLFNRRTLMGAGAILAVTARVAHAQASRRPVSGYAQGKGLKVYYEVHGGPLAGTVPTVLLHGGVMSIDTAFAFDDGFLPRLLTSGPVIAIEQQGHGHTADRDGPVTVDQMIGDTLAVLDHLKVEKAHFVGHSMGGMISVGMAIRHPARVASLTALSSGYALDGMLPELVAMQKNPTTMPSAALIPLLPTQQDFADWTASYQRNAPNPAAFQTVLGKLNAMNAAWKGWSEAELAGIRAPTLLGYGDKDFMRIEHVGRMAELIPGARLAILPGTTHMTILKRGAWLMPMIAEVQAKA